MNFTHFKISFMIGVVYVYFLIPKQFQKLITDIVRSPVLRLHVSFKNFQQCNFSITGELILTKSSI